MTDETLEQRVARLERQIGRVALWIVALVFGWLCVVVYVAGYAVGARR